MMILTVSTNPAALWRELECSGSRPPPLGDFTFNKIDKTRALLYGGRVERTTFSSVYILDIAETVREISLLHHH